MGEASLDAAGKGMTTHVVTDAIAAVNVQPVDGEKALEEMRQAGVRLVSSAEVLAKKS